MVKIKLNTVTRECIADSTFLGFEGENQANVLDFSFSDKFVDGTAVLNIKRGKDTGFVSVDKVGNGYQLPVKSSLLSQVGDVTFQFVITTVDGAIMKFDPFVMTVEDAIDTDVPLPEEYPSWVEMANVKLAEIDLAIEQANSTSKQILSDKANGVFDGKDGIDGTSPTAKVAQTAEGAEVTVTDAAGTTTATIKHGKDGTDGTDGISSEISVKTSTETEYVLTIKDKNGSFDTPNLKGKDSEGGIVNETDPVYLADKPKLALKSEIPTKVSELTNDSGYITDYTETDPTVPSHVKTITQSDITNWNNKQDVLTAGNNITIENGVISATGTGEGGLAELPIASADTLGGIKVGEGLEITEDGILSTLGGGSSYKQVELLSEPVSYTLNVAINKELALLDDVTKYDEIVYNYCLDYNSGEDYYTNTEYRVLVSNIVYNNSNNVINNKETVIMPIFTSDIRCIHFWFKTPNKMFIYKTTSGGTTAKYAIRITSIKGIKYGGNLTMDTVKDYVDTAIGGALNGSY